MYSARPQDAPTGNGLEGSTGLHRLVLPSNPFPVGYSAVGQSTNNTTEQVEVIGGSIDVMNSNASSLRQCADLSVWVDRVFDAIFHSRKPLPCARFNRKGIQSGGSLPPSHAHARDVTLPKLAKGFRFRGNGVKNVKGSARMRNDRSALIYAE